MKFKPKCLYKTSSIPVVSVFPKYMNASEFINFDLKIQRKFLSTPEIQPECSHGLWMRLSTLVNVGTINQQIEQPNQSQSTSAVVDMYQRGEDSLVVAEDFQAQLLNEGSNRRVFRIEQEDLMGNDNGLDPSNV